MSLVGVFKDVENGVDMMLFDRGISLGDHYYATECHTKYGSALLSEAGNEDWVKVFFVTTGPVRLKLEVERYCYRQRIGFQNYGEYALDLADHLIEKGFGESYGSVILNFFSPRCTLTDSWVIVFDGSKANFDVFHSDDIVVGTKSCYFSGYNSDIAIRMWLSGTISITTFLHTLLQLAKTTTCLVDNFDVVVFRRKGRASLQSVNLTNIHTLADFIDIPERPGLAYVKKPLEAYADQIDVRDAQADIRCAEQNIVSNPVNVIEQTDVHIVHADVRNAERSIAQIS